MRTATFASAALLLMGVSAFAQDRAVDPARVEAAIKNSWTTAPADWQPRFVQDETMKLCSAHENAPPGAEFEKIQAREKASIVYPEGGKLLGDWKKGEAIAQSGYGLRFTDYPARRENGGNCYACHQLTKQEVSYGTLGPSLMGYGKTKGFGAEEVKAVYEKIYNSNATAPCSLMPRFGHNKVLTVEQIQHLVALLMDPESPVNKGQ